MEEMGLSGVLHCTVKFIVLAGGRGLRRKRRRKSNFDSFLDFEKGTLANSEKRILENEMSGR